MKSNENESNQKNINKNLNRPKNIIRVIDPNAIKLRLAAEGKRFNSSKTHPLKRKNPNINQQQNQETIKPIKSDIINIISKPKLAKSLLAITKKRKSNTQKVNEKHITKAHKEIKDSSSLDYKIWSKTGKNKKNKKSNITHNIQEISKLKKIKLNGPISISNLAIQMRIKPNKLIAQIIEMGNMFTMNQIVDLNTAKLIAKKLEYQIQDITPQKKITKIIKKIKPEKEVIVSRHPVVTIMGHVDHGKTSLLNAIKQINTKPLEAGNITQHIKAYSVKTGKNTITFLDTPGHESFDKMRKRGASVTDIILLVIAANDGIMPQTKEVIEYSQKLNIPIIIAISKSDLINSNVNKIIQQLSEYGLIAESWGGDIQIYETSIKNKKSIDAIIEGILIQAELMELTTNENEEGEGIVIESKLDKRKGILATILIRSGIVKNGDCIVAGEHYGKIKAIYNTSGKNINNAYASMSINVLGLSGIPKSGDIFNVISKDKAYKTSAKNKIQQRYKNKITHQLTKADNNLLNLINKPLNLYLIIKTDVYGSTEAIASALTKLNAKEVIINIIYNAVGPITENDINLAVASKAVVIGFNINPDKKIQSFANKKKVEIKNYNIIYDALKDIEKKMQNLLQPTIKEEYIGRAVVRNIINVSKLGKIAGSYVTDGKIAKTTKAKIIRNGIIIHTCYIIGLKKFKTDSREIFSGSECGILLSNTNICQIEDTIECFQEKKEIAKLSILKNR